MTNNFPCIDTLEAYSTELRNLAMKILNLMAKTLRMEPNDMKELFKEGMQAMRMNYLLDDMCFKYIKLLLISFKFECLYLNCIVILGNILSLGVLVFQLSSQLYYIFNCLSMKKCVQLILTNSLYLHFAHVATSGWGMHGVSDAPKNLSSNRGLLVKCPAWTSHYVITGP